MTGFEIRWGCSVLESFAGDETRAFSAKRADVPFEHTLRTVYGGLTARAALGLRVAIWLGFWSPVWMAAKFCRLSALPHSRRGDLLHRMLSHRSFVVREPTLLLKMTACMALFAAPELRQASSFDVLLVSAETWDSHEPSGIRAKGRRLPLVAEHGKSSSDLMEAADPGLATTQKAQGA